MSLQDKLFQALKKFKNYNPLRINNEMIFRDIDVYKIVDENPYIFDIFI